MFSKFNYPWLYHGRIGSNLTQKWFTIILVYIQSGVYKKSANHKNSQITQIKYFSLQLTINLGRNESRV
jgi:uncharacterized protein YdgA (DUF945 family)